MKFFIIILCLGLERFLPIGKSLKRFKWLETYIKWLSQHVPLAWQHQSLWLVVIVLPLWLLVWAICMMTYAGGRGLPALLLDVGVLLYCFGPEPLFQPKETASQDVFENTCKTLFNVLFWFLLLGTSGALLYRLLERVSYGLHEQVEHSYLDEEVLVMARNLEASLAWLPARFFSIACALVGIFSSTIHCWFKYVLKGLNSNHKLLAQSGRLALGLQEEAELNFEQYCQALKLIDRVLILLLVMIFINTITVFL